jgi:hypothetical protein
MLKFTTEIPVANKKFPHIDEVVCSTYLFEGEVLFFKNCINLGPARGVVLPEHCSLPTLPNRQFDQKSNESTKKIKKYHQKQSLTLAMWAGTAFRIFISQPVIKTLQFSLFSEKSTIQAKINSQHRQQG